MGFIERSAHPTLFLKLIIFSLTKNDQDEAHDNGDGGEKAVKFGHNIPSLFFLLLTQSHNISSNRISPDSVPLIDYFLSVEIFRMYNIAWAHSFRPHPICIPI